MKIKQVIFTDKKQDGTPLVRNGTPFFMLHLELEDGKWVSKFYNHKEQDPTKLINLAEDYEVLFKQNWQYFNLISLLDKKWKVII